MNLGEFKREVEYLDPGMSVDTPPVERVVYEVEPARPGSVITEAQQEMVDQIQSRVDQINSKLEDAMR
jgi:hypothetical protein